MVRCTNNYKAPCSPIGILQTASLSLSLCEQHFVHRLLSENKTWKVNKANKDTTLQLKR